MQSGSSSAAQPLSGLRSLKRSWSGNSHDLDDDDDDGTLIAPTKSQRKEQSSSQRTLSNIEEDWEPTPPDQQAALRQYMCQPEQTRQALAQRENNMPNVFKPKMSDQSEVEEKVENQKTGVRVSGLSRGLTRTNSAEKPMASTTTSTSSSSRSEHASRPSTSSAPLRKGEGHTRHLPPGFLSKSRQQLADDRRRAGQAASFLNKGGKQTQRLSSNPDDEYKESEKNVPGMFRLSHQQLFVRDLVVEQGKNVFFTGSAGTGKSVLLRDIIKLLKKKFAKRGGDAVAITASTGIAACNIGGVTLHSFSGIGLGNDEVDVLLRKIRRNRKAMGRWVRTQVLIIDEVSMVEPDLLDKLEHIARALRKNVKPFGGIQIVITGDFFQLPPVMKGGTKFAFEAKMWDTVMEYKVNLTEVFRQKDETFVRMLNEMRHGKLSQDSIERFRQLSRVPQLDEGLVPTQLYPHREDVDRANSGRLAHIKLSGQSFEAKDGGELDPEARAKVLSNFMAPQKIYLKIGAQVMLIKNMDETLVNGSIGTVVAFMDLHEYQLAKLKYANLTDDDNLKDLREEQAQRKLRETSPVKTAMNSGSARNSPDPNAGMNLVGPDGKSLAKKMAQVSAGVKWPLVRFVNQPGGIPRTELMIPETWKNELPNGEVQASRTQVPLILAWAMSIHKAQGQTIPCCQIDLGKVFEKGQAYVALSRATCLEGLQVLNFNPTKVMAHPRVIEWSKSLATNGARL